MLYTANTFSDLTNDVRRRSWIYIAPTTFGSVLANTEIVEHSQYALRANKAYDERTNEHKATVLVSVCVGPSEQHLVHCLSSLLSDLSLDVLG